MAAQRGGRTEQISRHYLALRRMLWRQFSAERTWVLEWIRIPSDTCGRANTIWIRYVWTEKFLNPERESCGFENIRIRVDGASDSMDYTKRCIPYSIYLQIPTKMREKITAKNSTSWILLLWKRSNNSYSVFAEIRAKYNNIHVLSQVKTWCVYRAKKHIILCTLEHSRNTQAKMISLTTI